MHFRTMTVVALFAVALIARPGTAQTSRPSNGTAGASAQVTSAQVTSAQVTSAQVAPAKATTLPVEAMIIRRSPDSTAIARPAGAVKPATGRFDTTRVVLSLTIVLTLIFALRWLSQRLFGKTVASRSSRAVQVLSRNVISPKQQLLVVQVGRRLVVVGDCGQQMNPLCEITDPDEMAALIGQLHEEKREPAGIAFGSIFGRAGSAFEKETEPQRPVDVADEEEDSADDSTEGPTGPSHVQGTRDELSGLMDKVRIMSRQFRRT